MKRFAVMGNPIAHSLSPIIHQQFANAMGIELVYEKIAVEGADFKSQVAQFFASGGCGLNITAPFKEEAYRLAVTRTPRCDVAHAANTLWMNATDAQRLCADNTDGVGFIRDITHHINLPGQRVLILGAGGAARGLIAPLLSESVASIVVFNRTIDRARGLQDDFPSIRCVTTCSAGDEFDLLINATSAGLNPVEWRLSLGSFAPPAFCYDLAYALDKPTPFVQWAREQGAQGVDGLGMLVQQAAEAFRIWHGAMPEVTPVLHWLRSQTLCKKLNNR